MRLQTPAPHPKRTRPSGFWRYSAVGAAFAAVVLALRVPLWLLPGPGRDEAAYHYWAHHPEPAYAPLLQLAVRLSEFAGNGHSLWALRAPVIVLGLLVIFLNDRRLATTGATNPWRTLAALTLALCPWQSITGSLLHPDNFLLAAILGLVLAVQHNRLWLATLAAVTAVLAKPTGIIVLPVVWWLLNHMKNRDPRQLWFARGVLFLAAVGLVSLLKPDMVAGIADFGRMAPTVPWYVRTMAGGGTLLALGGPLLVAVAWIGIRQRLRDLRDDPTGRRQREARASLALAAMLLVFFLAAALLRGQFKGNWILPALVLLWPTRLSSFFGVTTSPKVRSLLVTGLVLTLLISVGQTVVMARPGIVTRVEDHLAARGSVPSWATYSTQAGVREAVVSTSRTWSDHLHEYDDASAFAEGLKARWCANQGAAVPVEWIVAADYGLACQVHWYFGEPEAYVAIYGDGVFHRTWNWLRECAPQDALLALSLPPARSVCSTELDLIKILAPVDHPVTVRPLQPAVVQWRAHHSQEKPHVLIP